MGKIINIPLVQQLKHQNPNELGGETGSRMSAITNPKTNAIRGRRTNHAPIVARLYRKLTHGSQIQTPSRSFNLYVVVISLVFAHHMSRADFSVKP
jgi:hypothetical protein